MLNIFSQLISGTTYSFYRSFSKQGVRYSIAFHLNDKRTVFPMEKTEKGWKITTGNIPDFVKDSERRLHTSITENEEKLIENVTK